MGLSENELGLFEERKGGPLSQFDASRFFTDIGRVPISGGLSAVGI